MCAWLSSLLKPADIHSYIELKIENFGHKVQPVDHTGLQKQDATVYSSIKVA